MYKSCAATSCCNLRLHPPTPYFILASLQALTRAHFAA